MNEEPSKVRAWTPVLSVAVFLLLVHGRPHPVVPVTQPATRTATPDPPKAATPRQRAKQPAKALPGPRLTPALIEQARAALEADGQRATMPRLAERLGVSVRSLYRAQGRSQDVPRPRVVAGEAPS